MAQTTSKQAVERAAAWLEDEGGVSAADGIATVDGDPPLQIELSADDVRLTLTHVTAEPGAGAGRADAVVSAFPSRGTMLHAAAAVDSTGVTITVTIPVYLDGLSRHSVVRALHELVAAVDDLGAGPTAQTRVHVPVEAAVESEPETEPAAEEAPDASAWSPTHRVPSGGLRAWEEPDPSMQPVTRLEARVELEVAELRGDWARVVGSNGWTGWVDARRLEEFGAAAATTAPTSLKVGGLELRPLPLIGAAALVLAAFLPWVDVITSINSFDVALSFLWDLNATGAPYLGFVLVGIAVVAVAVAAAKKPNPGLMLLVAIAALAVAGAFITQMYRGVTDGGGGFNEFFDWIGFGPWVALGGGVLLVVGARK